MVPDDIAKSADGFTAQNSAALDAATRLGSAKVTCDKCGHLKGGSKLNGQVICTSLKASENTPPTY